MSFAHFPNDIIDVILQYDARSWVDILRFGAVCSSWRVTSRKSIVWLITDLTFHAPPDYIHIYQRLLAFLSLERDFTVPKVTVHLPLKPDQRFTYACSEVQVIMIVHSDDGPRQRQQPPITELSEMFCSLMRDYNNYWCLYSSWWNCLYKLLIKIDDNMHSYKTFLLSSFFLSVQAFLAFIHHHYYYCSYNHHNQVLLGVSFFIAYIPLSLYSFLYLLHAMNIFAELLLQRTNSSFFPVFYWSDISTYFGNSAFMFAWLGCWFIIVFLTQVKLLHPHYGDHLPWTIVTLPVWLLYFIPLVPIFDSPGMKRSHDSYFWQHLSLTLILLAALPIPLTISTISYSYDHSLPLDQTIFPYLHYILYLYGIVMMVYTFISSLLAFLALQSIEWPNHRWKGTITIITSGIAMTSFYWLLIRTPYDHNESYLWFLFLSFVVCCHINIGTILFE